MNLFAKLALTPEGWAKNVRVTVDQIGRISAVESGVEANPDDKYLRNRILLPALANLHSHSFQRAMSGLTEKRLQRRDSFWSWRELMYSFLERLTPEQMEAIAALVFMEMLECGYASVGEFHYVHHQCGGQHYENIAETSCRVISAAQKAGIGLTHLPVLYTQGGLNGKALADGQLRFGNKSDEFLELLEHVEPALRNAPEDYLLGIAPHSLRAVSPESLKEIIEVRTSGPVHIHIAEQLKEVDDVLENYGARPVEWLLQNVSVDSRWCLIHATHLDERERELLAGSEAVAGLCPTTEANLGDGLFPMQEFLSEGGSFGIGSDSHISVSVSEELRWLEYQQRLLQRQRNLLCGDSRMSTGRNLFEKALAGGSQALGLGTGQLKEGSRADWLVLDHEHPLLEGRKGDALLDGWIFSGNAPLVRDVFVGGKQVIHGGRHLEEETIKNTYRKTLKRILS